MQRWIKKRGRTERHLQVTEMPPTKRCRITPWQVYLKEFGKSDGEYGGYPPVYYGFVIIEGKQAMETGQHSIGLQAVDIITYPVVIKKSYSTLPQMR